MTSLCGGSAPTVSVSIPARPGTEVRAQDLALRLDGAAVQVVAEPAETSSRRRRDRPSWRPWMRRASHHLVLHGDAVPHPDLLAQLHAAVAAQPDAMLSMFTPWDSYASHAVRIAAFAGRPWVTPPGKTLTPIATVLPADAAAEFADAADPRAMSNEGEALLRFARARGLAHYASNPSLVQVHAGRHDRSVDEAAATAFLPETAPPASWWCGEPLPTPRRLPVIHVRDGEPVSYEAPEGADDRWRIRSRRELATPHSRRLMRVVRDRLHCTETARSDLRAAASLLGAARVLCDQLVLAEASGPTPEGFGGLCARESAATLPLGSLRLTVPALATEDGAAEIRAAFVGIHDDVLEVLDGLR